MIATPYSYRVIRYVHDPAAGEMLNVGVLLYAPDAHYLGYKFEPLYRRLSDTFIGFDGASYKRYLGRLQSALAHVAEQVQPSLPLFEAPADLEAVTRLALPDIGGSFLPGPVLAGVTDDPAAELEALYDRMVASQYRRSEKTRRTDDDVWSVYRSRLPVEVRRQLTAKTFETEGFEETFPYAFKNEQWHVLEPVTMDYVDPSSIQRKAVDWLGRGVALDGHPELAELVLLLGAPQNEGLRGKYDRAKDLLHKLSVPHRLVEEDEAADYAEYLADYMREHGLIEDPEPTPAD